MIEFIKLQKSNKHNLLINDSICESKDTLYFQLKAHINKGKL